MSVITQKEIAEANKERLSHSAELKARAYLQEQKANDSAEWYKFLVRHSGHNATKFGAYFSCDANSQLMENWAKSHDKTITAQSLENAFAALGDSLAKPNSGPYVRQTERSNSPAHVIAQRPVLVEELILPYTRAEILDWSPARLRKEMERSPAHVKALNAILAEK